MENTENIKLIEGKFSPQDAKEVLIKLIDVKIGFHNLKNFSYEERFGISDKESKMRVKELTEAREKIISVIKQSVIENKKVIINSSIYLTVE